MQHADFFGNKLRVGDHIILTNQGTTCFLRGTVVSLTPKMVRVTYTKPQYNHATKRDEDRVFDKIVSPLDLVGIPDMAVQSVDMTVRPC